VNPHMLDLDDADQLRDAADRADRAAATARRIAGTDTEAAALLNAFAGHAEAMASAARITAAWAAEHRS
jgi:hypothetical protein